MNERIHIPVPLSLSPLHAAHGRCLASFHQLIADATMRADDILMLSSEFSNVPLILDAHECTRERRKGRRTRTRTRRKRRNIQEAERTSQKNGREGFRGRECRGRKKELKTHQGLFQQRAELRRTPPTQLTGFMIEELSVGAGLLISPGDLLTGASPGDVQTRREVTASRDRGPDTHSPAGSFPLFFFFFL